MRSMWIRTSPVTHSSASDSTWSGAGGHREHADRTTGQSPDHRADGQHAQQRAHRSSDASVAPTRGQRPSVGEHRSACDQVEDQVVGLVGRVKSSRR